MDGRNTSKGNRFIAKNKIHLFLDNSRTTIIGIKACNIIIESTMFDQVHTVLEGFTCYVLHGLHWTNHGWHAGLVIFFPHICRWIGRQNGTDTLRCSSSFPFTTGSTATNVQQIKLRKRYVSNTY